jgi:hypothetical protein
MQLRFSPAVTIFFFTRERREEGGRETNPSRTGDAGSDKPYLLPLRKSLEGL